MWFFRQLFYCSPASFVGRMHVPLGNYNTRVAKEGADGFDVSSLLNEPRAERMPQVVKPQP